MAEIRFLAVSFRQSGDSAQVDSSTISSRLNRIANETVLHWNWAAHLGGHDTMTPNCVYGQLTFMKKPQI